MSKISIKTFDAKEESIQKAINVTNIPKNDEGYEWIEPPVQLRGLKEMVKHSTILPQCIRAYKDNIAGFGIGIRYSVDEKETPEMVAEYNKLEQIVNLLNIEEDTKEVFEDLIEARETYGIAYLEVIRNVANQVSQIDFIKATETIKKTLPMGDIIETEYLYKGESIKRKRQFRKYKQEVNGKVVYFKEFGDPRKMDRKSGEYRTDIDVADQANEILEFKIGPEDYGEVRWIGQVLNIDGSRRAENLNNNYFLNGRHTPLMIVVSGGTLSDSSYTKLQEYVNDIKGENGQHAFMLLELEDTDNKVGFENDKKPTVEIKELASILQKDELFQEYLNNSRKKVQSAFRLPDLYLGYTSDFNRATAQTVQVLTEQQVFIPERKSLAWIINNKLLNAYGFKYVEVYFNEPDTTNPDDMVKIMSVTERAGGLTPNIARELTLKTIGKTSEDYDGEWGNIPVAVSKSQMQIVEPQIEKAIEKAVNDKDQDVLAVMRAVKEELLRLEE